MYYVFFSDPKDEFVVSPEYFLSVLPKCGKIVEAIKLKLTKKAPLPETIYRKQLFCVGIRRVLKSKSKNKLRSLQKYWEKNQKRKERRMVTLYIIALHNCSVTLN